MDGGATGLNGDQEEDQVWGVLGVRSLWGGQGVLTWARWQLRRCFLEASHLEGRDEMCKQRVRRELRFSGGWGGIQLTLVLKEHKGKRLVGRCIRQGRGSESGRPGGEGTCGTLAADRDHAKELGTRSELGWD